MYEKITYEIILQRMLNRVLEHNPNIDTREGSIIFDALAPAAIELQNIYIELDTILDETFADTASREMLIKRAAERGIIPEPATNAILKGEFNIDVSIGSRFSLDDLNYVVVEKISDGTYKMKCETLGNAGNCNFGVLIPIDYIEGLQKAQLTELLIPGEEEEETEHLRQRYFESLNSQSFGGNIFDYKKKVNAIQGVGGVKVYPTWNGGGTVKIVIINSSFQNPSETLVNSIQTIIDPTQNHDGLGIAPIGHVVTVESVQNTIINISTKIVLKDDWTWQDIKPQAEKVIDDYFKELSLSWADSSEIIVRISQLEIRLLSIQGVVDIAHTAINGAEENCILGKDNIPIRGDISG